MASVHHPLPGATREGRKPVLLGMNNPLSSDPDDALVPWPAGCTGHRIWRLLHSITGMDEQAYCAAFDRENLVAGRAWSRKTAEEEAPRVLTRLQSRVVIVLGAQTWAAFRFPVRPPEGFFKVVGPAGRWHYLPHPSGRCRWYNVPGNAEKAAKLLAELAGQAAADLPNADRNSAA